ncbi:Ig-like domain-containing protein, partial [Parapedobacter tibetensis]|uniref:Ig-like domain-containing protein n=1 Tax=Parapedobacter tibetensis TaxID=2972951 RepID=UPI00214D6107
MKHPGITPRKSADHTIKILELMRELYDYLLGMDLPFLTGKNTKKACFDNCIKPNRHKLLSIKKIGLTLLCLTMLLTTNIVKGQDQPIFDCEVATGYLFQGNPTGVYAVNLATGEYEEVSAQLIPGTENTVLNAAAYNVTDDYIWAYRAFTGDLVRIGSDWSVQIFPIAGLPTGVGFNVGDISSDGVMYLFSNTGGTNTIQRVDLDPESATYLQLLSPLSTTASPIADWAFSPIDGNLYGLGNTGYSLLRFNPTTGARTVVGTVTGAGIQGANEAPFGAAYMDAEGNLYVSSNGTGRIFRIANPHTGGLTAELISTGPSSTNNDGARCPATPVIAEDPVDLGIVKTGPVTVAPEGTVTYTLFITNAGPGAADGAVVTDPEVANFTAESISCTAGSGSGGDAGCPVDLTVANLQGSGLVIPTLPSGSSVTLTITGTAGTSGTITNVATVTAPAGLEDTNPDNNTDTKETAISPDCTGAQTVYSFDPDATLAQAGTISANGGTLNLVYNLTSGDPIPGMGNTFTIPLTYSDFNQFYTGSDHTWSGATVLEGSWDVVISTRAFVLVPNTNNLYQALPANNTSQKPWVSPNISDNFFTTHLSNGTLDQLGTFDITIGALPAAPEGVRLISESIRIFSTNNLSTNGNGFNQAGWWVKPIAQNGVHTATSGSQTIPLSITHGKTYTFKYSAFTDNSTFTGGERGALLDLGEIVFCTPQGPIAVNDSASTDAGTPVIIPVLPNDSIGDSPIDSTSVRLIDPVSGDSVTTVTVPNEGTYEVDPTTGEVTFTPETGFTGVTTPVEYVVSDENGVPSNQATITVTVSVSGQEWPVLVTDNPPQGSQFNCQTLYISRGASNIVALVNDADGNPLLEPVARYVGNVGGPNPAPADGFGYWVGSLAIGTDPETGNQAAFGTTWGHGGQSGRPIYKMVSGEGTLKELIINGTPVTTPDLHPWGGLAYNSVDGMLYGIVNNSQQQNTDYIIFRMDLETGAVEQQTVSLPGATQALGSIMPDMFFDVEGAGYLGAKTNAPGSNPWTLYRIDFTQTEWVGEPVINFTGLNSFDFYGAAYLNGFIYLGWNTGVIYKVPFEQNLAGIELTTSYPHIADYSTNIETPPSGTPSQDGFAVSDLGSCALAPVIGEPPVAVNDTASTAQNTPVIILVLANDSIGGSPLDSTSVKLIDPVSGDSVTTVTVPNEGTYEVDPTTGEVTFTPEPDFTGETTPVEYVVNDENGVSSNLATITVTVNEGPIAVDDTSTTTLDTPVTIPVLDNDTPGDAPIDPSTVTITIPPTSGTVAVDPTTGEVEYMPNPGYTGPDEFEYTVEDENGIPSNPATVTIDIQPEPGNPEIALVKEGSYQGDPNMAMPGDTITYTFTVTNTGDVGVKDITIDDAKLGITGLPLIQTEDLPFTATINFSEYAFPAATTDAGIIVQGPNGTSTVPYNLFDDNTGDKLAADNSDLSDLMFTYRVSPSGNLGTTNRPDIRFRSSGVLGSQITNRTGYAGLPEANNPGTRQFIEVKVDFAKHLKVDNVSLNFSSLNTAGTVWEYSEISYLNENSGLFSAPTSVSRYLDFEPGQSGNTSLGNYLMASTGTVVGVGTNQTSSGSSNPPADGPTILDGSSFGLTDQTIGGFLWRTTLEDVGGISSASNPNFSSSLREMTVSGTISTQSTTLEPGESATVIYTYVITEEDIEAGEVENQAIAAGLDPVDNEVSDNSGTDVDNDDPTVTPLPATPPTAVNDTAITALDTPITIPVLDNDTVGSSPIDSTTVTITTPPTNGTVEVDPVTGEVTYTPDDGFTGEDTFEYTVDDENGMPSNPATVTVTIVDGPVANDDGTTTTPDTPVTIPVLDNDTPGDAPLDSTTVTITTPPTNGTVEVDPETGEITYTPDPGFEGEDTFEYTVDDETGVPSNPATVTIVVAEPVGPTANDDGAMTPINTPVTIPVLDNDEEGDAPLDSTTVTITTPPTNGTVEVDPVTGEVTYTPDDGFTGEDTFEYTVEDENGVPSNPATVTVTIVDGPVANDDGTTTTPDTPVTIPVLDNDTPGDAPLDSTTVTITTPPTNGTVEVDPETGDITYTPDPGYTGPDTFEYTVDDENGVPSNPATVTVDVAEPQPPTANDDGAMTPINTPVTIPVLGNDEEGDAPLDSTTVTITTPPTNGTVEVDPVTGEVTYTPDDGFTGEDT